MDPKTLVLQYLDEAHATETALVTNLRAHITMTTEGSYRTVLERHLEETQRHARNISRRRKELGGKDGRGLIAGAVGLARDAVGQALVLTKGPLDIVRTMSQPERMLKNARDECVTEVIEIAMYDALEALAKAAGDEPTARLAAEHRADEEKALRDLRKEIPKLASATLEDRTDATAKPLTSRSTTTRRTSSGRATSGGSRSKPATRKAATAKRSTTTKRSSSSSTTRKRPTAKKS